MKRTCGLGILSAVAILGGGTFCYAAPQVPDNNQPAGGPPPAAPREMTGERKPAQAPQMGMPSSEMLKQAGATDAQIQALTDVYRAQMEKQGDLRAAADQANSALMRLMTGTNTDEKAVLAAADTLNQARGELFKLNLVGELKRKQILGEELLRKIREMRPSPISRMPGMGGPGAVPNAGGSSAAGRPDGGARQPPPPPPPTVVE